MAEKFNAGIIGCGRIAGGYDPVVPDSWSATHAGAYRLCPDTELVCAADSNTAALEEFGRKWGVTRCYSDYREMLATEPLDIVSLCLPTEYHLEAFQETVKYNIPALFCEKPLAYNLIQAREIFDLGKDRVVAVNYFRRWNPTIAGLVEEIRSGVYGRCLSAVVRYPKGVFVNASHFIDMMRWMFGEPETVRLHSVATPDAIDPGLHFMMSFPMGPEVFFINLPRIEYVFAEVDILAENARLIIGQRGQIFRKEKRVRDRHYQLFDVLEKDVEVETEWRNCPARAIGELAHILRSGGRPSCTLNDGLRTVEICSHLRDLAQ